MRSISNRPGIAVCWIIILCSLSTCGGGGTSATPSGSTVSAASTWTEEGAVLPGITSSCTIVESSAYRMYYQSGGDIVSAVSTDGRTFGSPVTAISRVGGEMLSNPSVLRLADGRYLMIFNKEISSDRHVFLRATSTDGVSFTRYQGELDDGAVMSPNSEENGFISVPDMVEFNGKIYLYYVANKNLNRIFYSTSDDEGITWTRGGQISLSGVGYADKTVDPDVIILPDGGARLFFAHSYPSEQGFGMEGIKSAISTDGVSFTVEGEVIPASDSGITIDPDVVSVIGQSGVYRMYLGKATDGGELSLYSAISG